MDFHLLPSRNLSTSTSVIFEQQLGGRAQRIQSLVTELHKTFIGTNNDDRQKISENKKE